MLGQWTRWAPALVTTVTVGAIAAAMMIPGGEAQEVQSERGRFIIIMSPTVRADTFLLDTVSGQVWRQEQFTDVKGEPTVWHTMVRLDNAAESHNFIEALGLKSPSLKPER